MRTSFVSGAVGAIVFVAAAGCGPPPAVQSPAPPSLCEILPAHAAPADTVTVALLDAVDSAHAPLGRNDGERLVFEALYETLIVVDCHGTVCGALAVSWEKIDDGRTWTFVIRDDARFWDGSIVTADDVISSWSGPIARYPGLLSVVARDERTIVVHLAQPSVDVPRMFAAPAFAVTKLSAYSRWPEGTGAHRVTDAYADGRDLMLQPVSSGRGPVVRFIEYREADARDAFEQSVDLMITENPGVIDYVAGQPRFATRSLDWNRTYVLLSNALARGERPGALPEAVVATLARDAVRAEARGSRPTGWWSMECGRWMPPRAGAEPAAGAPADNLPRRIVFDARDMVARDLAGRFVAVSTMDPGESDEARELALAVPGLSGGSRVVAAALDAGDLERSLAGGDDFAYIVALPLRPVDPCLAACDLAIAAPWLFADGRELESVILPLVDTRPSAIVSGRAGLSVDGSGNARLNVSTGGREVTP